MDHDEREVPELDPSSGIHHDRTAAHPAGGGQPGSHPYRQRTGRRDALLEQRRALSDKLEAYARVAKRATDMQRDLDALDRFLVDDTRSLVAHLRIAKPCRQKWEDMPGDGRRRHCGRCDRTVHDLSTMSGEEIEALFARAKTTPCVRLHRRRDGRVVTGDCPPPQRRMLALAAATAAGVALGAGATAAMHHAYGADDRVATERPRVTVQARPVALPAPRSLTRPIRVAALTTDPEPEAFTTMGEPLIDDRSHRGRVAMGRPDPMQPASQPELARAIGEVDKEHVVRVDRAFWRELLRDPWDPALRHVARVIPNEDDDGHLDGVRLYGIRRSSLLGRLGIQNGDLVREINGMSPTEPQDVLQSIRRIRNARQVRVALVRRGSPLTLRILPRPGLASRR